MNLSLIQFANVKLADVNDVVKRIERRISNPDLKQKMIDKVEEYAETKDPRFDLDNHETHQLYPTDELGDEFDIADSRRELDINWSSHSEYRSDLRDVDPNLVNVSIRDLIDVKPKFNKHEKVKITKPFGKVVVDLDGRRPSDVEADVVTVMD